MPSDWKYFDQQIKDLYSGVYKKVPLLLEGQQCTIQVSTRSHSQKQLEVSATYKDEIESKLKKVGEYVERLSESLEIRFKDKIELWLVQTENIFDFHKLLQPIITREELIKDPMTHLENLIVFENVSSTLMPPIKNQYLRL